MNIKKTILIMLLFLLTASMVGCGKKTQEAVYLGVKQEASATRKDVLDPEALVYCFNVAGKEKTYALDSGTAEKDDTDGEYADVKKAEEGAYPIQNILEKGKTYRISVKNRVVTAADPVDEETEQYVSEVKAEAGQKTLKNFLATACEPLGTVLYVYGGGWDFQDAGSANQTRTIGISPSWVGFFNENTADYQFETENENGTVYFPINAWNTYYYCGLDCSGYVGWVLYNTMYTESLSEPGFVRGSTKIAKALAEEYGFGTWEHPSSGDDTGENSLKLLKLMKTGDVVSIPGHVYIVIGKCSDGSAVIIHSTVTDSSTGAQGGGVQLSAINADGSDSISCEAYELANRYNQKYFPKWAERYPTVVKPAESYLSFPEEKPATGIFHWNLEGGVLSDPDQYSTMDAEEILEDLFGSL